MVCPKCFYRMTELGCTVEHRPAHWCPSCGTLRTCDGVVVTPTINDQWQKLYEQTKRLGVWPPT